MDAGPLRKANLKTAKALDLVIAESFLIGADQVMD
ncbi:hypothetical protein ABH973_004609 [Bradyrhizobium ottawaense]